MSASHWFENANHNVKDGLQTKSDFDHDPPFYLKREVSDPTATPMSANPSLGDAQVPVTKDDSETEDLRSVIDDLTVENKRLRQMLRERRPPHDPKLDHDKIFEIRTCGLSSKKKRELEAILQKFAYTIIDGSTAPSHMDDSALHMSSSAQTPRPTVKMAPYLHTDSAYASISNSGLISVRPSIKNESETNHLGGSKNNNVDSYLPDVPDSLLPKNSPVMTEKAKMRLVVKRLEQLFTGKDAAPGEHSQPLQQQKLSESAANAGSGDLQLQDLHGRPEGAREAHIFPFDAKMDLDRLKGHSRYKRPLGPSSESERSSDGRSSSDNHSIDQRPTRPLDLDIHRAQDAEENMEYIRHLGLPTPRHCDPTHSDDGWVYLNLLINLAQLHMMNVTPAFVRKAVAHLSRKLELSHDGTKIRWKGHYNGPRLEEDNRSNTHSSTASSAELVRDPTTCNLPTDDVISDNLASVGSSTARAKQRLTMFSSEEDALTYHTRPGIQPSYGTQERREMSTSHYKPMVAKHLTFFRDNITYDDPYIRLPQGAHDAAAQDLSAKANQFSQNYSGRSEDEGPIIYYKNLVFYCDMSGDKQDHQGNMTTSPLASKQILGTRSSAALLREEEAENSLIRAGTASNCSSNCSANDCALLSFELAPLSEKIVNQDDSYELLASGIGGVVPEDHFILRVQRKRQRTRPEGADGSDRAGSDESRFYMDEEILSNIRVDLPASKLPPPSYVLFSLSSASSGSLESDESSAKDADDSETGLSAEGPPPRGAFSEWPSTDASGQHLAIIERNSPSIRGSPKGVDYYTDAEQVYGFDDASMVDRPFAIVTGAPRSIRQWY